MKRFFNNVRYSVALITCFVSIALIILFSNRIGQIDIKVGDVSETDIYAPRAIVDEETTNARKKAVRDSVKNVYVCDDSKRVNSVEALNEFFSVASTLREDTQSENSAKAAQLKASTKLDISEKACANVISSKKSVFSKIREVTGIVNLIMAEGVSNIEVSKEACNQKISLLDLSFSEKKTALEIAASALTENLELDKDETERRKLAAENSVATIEYKKNQIILRRGEVVSEAQLAMLRQLGMLKGTSAVPFTYTLGIIILSVLCYLILLFYFSSSSGKYKESSVIIAIMGLITVVMVFYASRFLPEKFAPLLPIGLFACTVSTFSMQNAAYFSNIIISIFCGVVFQSDWRFTVIMILCGSVCAYAFGKVKRRAHLFPAAVMSAFVSGLIYFAFSLIEASGAKAAVFAFLLGFSGGFLSGILTIGTIPFWEWLLNATTPMKLTELSNPENKLLKKLLIEAPGTYHHSLTVANIAEIAAREIKADSLLARVGAYYHDIGKLRHPQYFKENQYNKNIHDTLSPEESSSIIINHVEDGREIAIKNRLPKSICDIISQHHGTTTTGYFLTRAKQKNPETDEALFTYPGPVPVSKESAIVMLADSCEAAVRSITEKNEEKIEAMVRRITTERLNSGQLSHCDLTFNELEVIITVITKTLGGYFHERIKYE